MKHTGMQPLATWSWLASLALLAVELNYSISLIHEKVAQRSICPPWSSLLLPPAGLPLCYPSEVPAPAASQQHNLQGAVDDSTIASSSFKYVPHEPEAPEQPLLARTQLTQGTATPGMADSVQGKTDSNTHEPAWSSDYSSAHGLTATSATASPDVSVSQGGVLMPSITDTGLAAAAAGDVQIESHPPLEDDTSRVSNSLHEAGTAAAGTGDVEQNRELPTEVLHAADTWAPGGIEADTHAIAAETGALDMQYLNQQQQLTQVDQPQPDHSEANYAGTATTWDDEQDHTTELLHMQHADAVSDMPVQQDAASDAPVQVDAVQDACHSVNLQLQDSTAEEEGAHLSQGQAVEFPDTDATQPAEPLQHIQIETGPPVADAQSQTIEPHQGLSPIPDIGKALAHHTATEVLHIMSPVTGSGAILSGSTGVSVVTQRTCDPTEDATCTVTPLSIIETVWTWVKQQQQEEEAPHTYVMPLLAGVTLTAAVLLLIHLLALRAGSRITIHADATADNSQSLVNNLIPSPSPPASEPHMPAEDDLAIEAAPTMATIPGGSSYRILRLISSPPPPPTDMRMTRSRMRLAADATAEGGPSSPQVAETPARAGGKVVTQTPASVRAPRSSVRAAKTPAHGR